MSRSPSTKSNLLPRPYYEDDYAVIYHGDCRELLPQITDIDFLLSDPPYGMDYQHGARRGGRTMGMDGHSIAGDQEPFDPTPLLGYRQVALWGANHYSEALPASRGWLVWDKRDGTPSNDQSDAEMAWTNFLTVARVFSARWSGGHRTGREQAQGRVHVNQKPVALMTWCIRWAGEGGLICDPYMGSGSTLVAAKEMNRKVVGIELEERYCDIAAGRLAQEVLDFGEAA